MDKNSQKQVGKVDETSRKKVGKMDKTSRKRVGKVDRIMYDIEEKAHNSNMEA